MAHHRLKVWSQYFDALKSGDKTFEVRKDDRGFQKGDTLSLVCVIPWSDANAPCTPTSELRETEEIVERTVSYILTGGQWGIAPGIVVLGLK